MSIIIVGGGMAGATLALAISQLTQGKLAVHLIEAVSLTALLIRVLMPELSRWHREPASN